MTLPARWLADDSGRPSDNACLSNYAQSHRPASNILPGELNTCLVVAISGSSYLAHRECRISSQPRQTNRAMPITWLPWFEDLTPHRRYAFREGSTNIVRWGRQVLIPVRPCLLRACLPRRLLLPIPPANNGFASRNPKQGVGLRTLEEA